MRRSLPRAIITFLSIAFIFCSHLTAKESAGFISVYDDIGSGFGAIEIMDSAAADPAKKAILQRQITLNKYAGADYCIEDGYLMYRLFLPPGMKQTEIAVNFEYDSNAVVYFMVESGVTTMDIRNALTYASSLESNVVYKKLITNNGSIFFDNSDGQLDRMIGDSGRWVYLAIANDTAVRSSGFNDGVDTDFILNVMLELKADDSEYETWRRLAYFEHNGDPVQTQYNMVVTGNKCAGDIYSESFALKPSSDNECIKGKSIYKTFWTSMFSDANSTAVLTLNHEERFDITSSRIYYNNDIPYAPNDLTRLKFYVPAGVKKADVDFMADAESTIAIYHKVIADGLLKIDTLDDIHLFESNNTEDIYGLTLLKDRLTLHVNTSQTISRGGWVYIDIAKDPFRPDVTFVADNTPQMLNMSVSLSFEDENALNKAIASGFPQTDPVERIILRKYRSESKGEGSVTEIYCLDDDVGEVKPPVPAKYDEMEAFDYQVSLLGSSAAFSCDIPKIYAPDLCSLYKDAFDLLDGEFSLGPCTIKASVLECQTKQFDRMCRDLESSLDKYIMETSKGLFQFSGVESVINNIDDTFESGSCNLFDSATEKAEQQALERTDALYEGIDFEFFQLEQHGSRTKAKVMDCVYRMKKQGASAGEIQKECHPNRIIENKIALNQDKPQIESEQLEIVNSISTAALTGLKENSAQEKDTKNKLIDQCGELKESAAITACEKTVYEENNFNNKSASLLADLKSRKAVAQKLASAANSTDSDIIFGTTKQSEILPVEKQNDFSQTANKAFYYDILNDTQSVSMQKLEEEMLQINEQKREIMATPLYEQHIQNEVAKMF
jgi:hypothetical protein